MVAESLEVSRSMLIHEESHCEGTIRRCLKCREIRGVEDASVRESRRKVVLGITIPRHMIHKYTFSTKVKFRI